MRRLTHIIHINFVNIFLIFIILCPTFSRVQANEGGSTPDTSSNSWFKIKPINSVTIKLYDLKTRYPTRKYLLVNSDGDYINRNWTPFFQIEGGGNIFSRINFNYKFQNAKTYSNILKRASLKYQTESVSFEIARGSVWLGHGYHGSLLLSNNAEPFRLIKFQTEKPFSVPFIGKFSYMIFNGWPENFKIIGHRLSWFPVPWLELGGNQTIVYKRDYKFWEFFRIFAGTESNVPSIYNNDQRASMDIAFHLPFIKNIFPTFTFAKIYFEYAGEDLYAYWQDEDPLWVGPLGFELLDIGNTMGILLTTSDNEFILEYSQNYRNSSLFHNFIGQFGYERYTTKWYGVPKDGNPIFINNGSFMGHHMGQQADDLYLHFKHNFDRGSLKLFYNFQRRGLVLTDPWPPHLNNYPEELKRYGLEAYLEFKNIAIKSTYFWNYYDNININPDNFGFQIIPRRQANEYILGIEISYKID